jgi:hypothetical protein
MISYDGKSGSGRRRCLGNHVNINKGSLLRAFARLVDQLQNCLEKPNKLNSAMVRQVNSGGVRRKSGRAVEPSLQRLVHLNDDAGEKESRRLSSSDSRRASLVQVARDTIRRNDSSSLLETNLTPIMANFEQWMRLVKDNVSKSNRRADPRANLRKSMHQTRGTLH